MDKIEIKELVKATFPRMGNDILQHMLDSASYVKNVIGTKLIRTGERHNYFYLIVKGSVKTYYLKDTKQVCTWFAFENDIVATLTNVVEGNASRETVELLEDSEFIRFETQSLRNLTQSNLAASHLMTGLIVEHALFLEERHYLLQFMSSKERYEALIERAPQVSQKVTLTDIASFLGVSRETVSRIRSMK